MARLPRYSIANQTQHIILQGIEGRQLYFEEQDYQYFHDCLDAAAYNYRLKLHAYVLMPDHVHILATPANADSVSRSIQSIGRNYVQYFNESYDSTGTLWESRYRATVIEPKAYLLACSQYIETNPVRSGLVDRPQDFRWSSYAHNAQAKTDEMFTDATEYKKLGASAKERARAYRALFRKPLSDELVESITTSAMKGWALGDARFIRKIEKLSGRRASQLPRGRPRGS